MSNTTKKQIIDETSVIQRLLYDYPLYNYINEENVNILVLGYSTFTERFIDCAFEMAQVNTYKLHITFASDNIHSKNEFLAKRPAFKKFFSIDEEKVEDDYGTLNFAHIAFDNIDNTVSELLLNDKEQKFAYIFIGTDDDALNTKIAESCVDCKELLDAAFVINCVKDTNDSPHALVHYVSRNDSILNHKDYKNLKRMAFNCHLVWNSDVLLDIRKLQREFSGKYNFNSSFNNILSIKYKLNSVGIDFHNPNAAQKFVEKKKKKNGQDKKHINDLIQAEHKRWNVNLIAQGFQSPDTLKKYVSGEQSKSKKYHCCLVRSSNEIGLNKEWSDNNYAKWNTASDKELNRLDPLDKVSVKLHRLYKKEADFIRQHNLLAHAEITEVNKLVEPYPRVFNEFNKYLICLQEINAGNNQSTSMYRFHKSRLEKAVAKDLPVHIKKLVRDRVKTIDDSFAKIIQSQKYIDYKLYDRELVLNIGFILTYKTTYHLGIPIAVDNSVPGNRILFANIAAALVINPSRVTFFFDYKNSEKEALLRALKYSVICFENHNLRTTIRICLMSDKKVNSEFLSSLPKLSKRIRKVDVISYNSYDPTSLNDKLNDYIRINRFSALEKNDSATSKLLFANNCYQNNLSYTYNWRLNQFEHSEGFVDFECLPFRPILKINDLFAVNQTVDYYSLPDLEEDYKYFWKLYRSTRERQNTEKDWKALCAILEEIDQKNRFTIDISGEITEGREHYVEQRYMYALTHLVKDFKEMNPAIRLMEKYHSNSVYTVKLFAPNGVIIFFEQLLAQPQMLLNYADIHAERVSSKEAKVYYNDLSIVPPSENLINMKAKEKNADAQRVKKLFKKLINDRYIAKYTDDAQNRFLSYSSFAIKELLTQEGKLLEIFVYYSAIEESNAFEVATGVEVKNKKTTENEFDLLLTGGGYRSIILECKAQSLLKQEFYYKLHALNNKFGINSTPVIVADCNPSSPQNQRVAKYGESLGIKTIMGSKDIDSIGTILRQILNN